MLGILVHSNGDEVTLKCRGNVVAGRCVQILRMAAEMGSERTVVLDLSQVKTLDAAGLGVLVELHETLKRKGRELRLEHLSSRVKRTISLVNLHRVLKICNGHAVAA